MCKDSTNSNNIVSCSLPSDYKTQLLIRAEAQAVSVSELTRSILMEHLNKRYVMKTVLEYLSNMVEK